MYVVKGKSIPFEERATLKLKVFPMILSNKTEFVYIESETGHGATVVQRISDFAYFIISGSGYFEINGEKENCEQGDLVVVPAGTKYNYFGKMNIVASSTPPWKEEQQITL